MPSLEFRKPPNLELLHCRALMSLSKARKIKSRGNKEGIRASWSDVRLDTSHLREYLSLCEFPDSTQTPVSYLHMLMNRVNLAMLCDRSFPHNIIGAIHRSEELSILQPIDSGKPLNFSSQLYPAKEEDSAYVYSLEMQAQQNYTTVWKSQGEISFRKHASKKTKSLRTKDLTQEIDELEGCDETRLEFAKTAGQTYAKISKDYNPIHLKQWSARLLGYDQPISHGMFTFARILAQFEQAYAKASIRFLAPVFLPSQTVLHTRRSTQGISFRLTSPSLKTLHATGEISQS